MRGSFHDWIRVIVNLAKNSNIDRNERLVAALRGSKQLSLKCGADFLSCIANGALDESGGFNQQQQREERLKAQLILRNTAWRPLIERAETHLYFRGDIEFLLRFSGVFDRAAQNGRCDWSDEEDGALRQSFADWYDRVCVVFPENATAWPAPFPDFLWERALLATGDYLLPRGRNWSFLDDKDRDASWKRLLRADTRVSDREARRDVVRRVLVRVDPKDVVGSLQAIVAAGVQGEDAAPLPGFRRRLVLEPRLIGYCRAPHAADRGGLRIPSSPDRSGTAVTSTCMSTTSTCGSQTRLAELGAVRHQLHRRDWHLPALAAPSPHTAWALADGGEARRSTAIGPETVRFPVRSSHPPDRLDRHRGEHSAL